jgi:hypothetical protein
VIPLSMVLYVAAAAKTYGSKPMPDQDRGTGRTTRQMQTAPQGAAFVWSCGMLGYPKALARHLGRADLSILPASDFEGGQQRGRTFSAVVVDHAVGDLTDEQWREIIYAMQASPYVP